MELLTRIVQRSLLILDLVGEALRRLLNLVTLASRVFELSLHLRERLPACLRSRFQLVARPCCLRGSFDGTALRAPPREQRRREGGERSDHDDGKHSDHFGFLTGCLPLQPTSSFSTDGRAADDASAQLGLPVASSSASSIQAVAASSAAGSLDFTTTSTSLPCGWKLGYEPTRTPG